MMIRREEDALAREMRWDLELQLQGKKEKKLIAIDGSENTYARIAPLHSQLLQIPHPQVIIKCITCAVVRKYILLLSLPLYIIKYYVSQ